jgi:hypothetical protein
MMMSGGSKRVCAVIAAVVVVALLLLFRDTDTPPKKETLAPMVLHPTNITFFGDVPQKNKIKPLSTSNDTGHGVTGVDLYLYGHHMAKRNIYPVAVHGDHSYLLYKVIKVYPPAPLKPILGHIVDICNPKHKNCTNKNAHGLNFLVDVHQTAWKKMGAPPTAHKTGGILPGSFQVIGYLGPCKIPRNLWKQAIQKGSEFMVCKVADKTNKLQYRPIAKCCQT